MIFLSLLLCVSPTTITSDFGKYTNLDYNLGFNCWNPLIVEKTILFSGTFVNVPQIIMSPDLQDEETTNNYVLSILNPTTTQFTIQLQCLGSRVWHFFFRWAAIDDHRIEVINSFSNSVTNLATKTLTYSHSNVNALQGFISVLNLEYSGYINFSVNIDSITATDVTVIFTSSNQLMTSVGFQIVLGTAEAFTQSSLITTISMTSSSYYTSPVLPILAGNYLFIPFTGAKISTSSTIRAKVIDTYTSTTVTYTYAPRIISYIDLAWPSTIDSLTQQYVWITTVNTKVLYPILYKKMRMSKLYDKLYSSKPVIQMILVEPNLIVTESTTPSSSNSVVDKTHSLLNVVASIQCIAGKKITGSFLKASSPATNMVVSQNCYGSINMITFNIQFYQQEQVNQKLTVTVTSSSAIVTQTIYNQAIETYNIISISLSNI